MSILRLVLKFWKRDRCRWKNDFLQNFLAVLQLLGTDDTDPARAESFLVTPTLCCGFGLCVMSSHFTATRKLCKDVVTKEFDKYFIN